DAPSPRLQPLQEGAEPRLVMRIVRRCGEEDADAAYTLALLRARRESIRRSAEEKRDECAAVAVGAPVTGRPPRGSVHAAFPHTACMGLSLSRVHHAIFVVLCCFILCSASILPSRPHITVAVAHSDGQGRRFFSAAEGLSFTNASTAAGC